MSEPDYYVKNGLSPLKAYKKGLLSKEEYKGFLKGNIIKYAVRCDDKGGVADMDKCIDYCKHLKGLLEPTNVFCNLSSSRGGKSLISNPTWLTHYINTMGDWDIVTKGDD